MFKKIMALSLGLSSQVAGALSYTMEITEQELQKKVSAMMPLEKQKRYYQIVVSDPEVELIKETNQIGLFANLNVAILRNLKGKGHAKVIGSIDYNPDKGTFYLRNPKIISLVIDKIPEQYELIIKTVTEKALAKILARNSIYKFKDDSIKHKLTKSILKSVKVENQRLRITFSMF